VTIPTLIDKQDTFEIVRDQIAMILKTEVISQMALATTAMKDPEEWNLRIFSERSNPWEQLLNQQTVRTPIVNVWFDNSNFLKSKSNIGERQQAACVYNIDCLGFGVASDNPGGGHNPGDKEAAFELQRTLRLVRNILMAAEYTHLLLRGTVASRWPQSITAMQPPLSDNPIQQVAGGRIAFNVEFLEFSPQVASETLELLSLDIKRAETGELLAEADYDYS